MAIAHRGVTGQTTLPRPWVTGLRFPVRLVARSASTVGRMFTGSGGGYRSYPREGFPEYELHQIVAGRKDRFDGPM